MVKRCKKNPVQFPYVEELDMLVEFEEFKLKGTNAYIRVLKTKYEVKPDGSTMYGQGLKVCQER